MYSEGANRSQIQSHGGANGALNGHGTVSEEDGEHKASGRTVGSGEYASPTLRKRKSGTFWKRRSSMGLNGEEVYHTQETGNGNGNATGHGKEDFAAEKRILHHEDAEIGIEHENSRPKSPPPIIPEIDGMRDGGYLGGEELFKHIG